MARRTRTEGPSGYTLLLVDDSLEYLETTRLILERAGHTVLTASDGQAALDILRQTNVDLLLLDYFMPGFTGEDVVTELRTFNPYIQIILQTGYASEQPPREMLRRLDIQGYYDKSEGPEKLLLWTDVGLKTVYTLQLLHKSRQGLRYILDITPELHKIQPLDDLLQGLLWQVAGLMGATHSFLAILPSAAPAPSLSLPDGFVALAQDESDLVIHASTGRFAGAQHLDGTLESQKVKLLHAALRSGTIEAQETHTIMPLRVGELTVGVIFLDRPIIVDSDLELLQIFANQAAVAIQNSQLYEMATLDPLTGVYVRRFFEQWLQRDLRTAFRAQQPVCLLMMDMDHLKQINDRAGHLAGDQALALVGKILRQAVRGSDIVGRYGGDEFAVILPHTDLEGAGIVAARILSALSDKSISNPKGDLSIRGSVGLGILLPHQLPAASLPRPIPNAYFQTMAISLLAQVDKALYHAKQDGGNRIQVATPLEWPPFTGQAW